MAEARVWRVALGLLLGGLFGCVTIVARGPAPPESEALAEPESGSCSYLATYVDARGLTEEFQRRDLEPLRRSYLALYRDAAQRLGLRIVPEREDAWLELWVGASWTTRGRVRVDFYLTPTLRLEQHFFVALTGDPEFPYRGRSGSVHHEEVPPDVHPVHFADAVDFAVRRNWEKEAEQVLALCALEDTLADEGWSSIDELKDELMREIQRARRDRAQRSLSIEVEHDGAP